MRQRSSRENSLDETLRHRDLMLAEALSLDALLRGKPVREQRIELCRARFASEPLKRKTRR